MKTADKICVSYSGGIGSWCAAKRLSDTHGPEKLTLLFADTLIEDETTYRFLIQGAANILGLPETCSHLAMQLPKLTVETPWEIQCGGPYWMAQRKRERAAALVELRTEAMRQLPGLVWIADGRTPWDVFKDERFIGNSRIDPCSKILKRQLLDRWRKENMPDSVTAIGLDWSEYDRVERYRVHMPTALAPMLDKPYMTKVQKLEWALAEGLNLPWMYLVGFGHGNCGGWCCKMGKKNGADLLRARPGYYLWNEREEQFARMAIGNAVACLIERRGGESNWVTLTVLRNRFEVTSDVYADMYEGGEMWRQLQGESSSCGCALE